MKTEVIMSAIQTALAISNFFGIIINNSGNNIVTNFSIVTWMMLAPILVKIYLGYFEFL